MLNRLRHSITYANVASTVAVFLALGGVSYAAVTLPNNSVGTKQIKNNAVTLAKISKGAHNALKGERGASGATGAQGSSGAAGPAGARGLTGATGAQGPAGIQGPKGDQGIQGLAGSARAYGEVALNGSVTNSKGSPTVTNPTTGTYCLTVPGVDPATTTVAITLGAGADSNAAPPREQLGTNTGCPTGTWQITVGSLEATTGNLVANTEPFSFIVP